VTTCSGPDELDIHVSFRPLLAILASSPLRAPPRPALLKGLEQQQQQQQQLPKPSAAKARRCF